jgi:hypothetical protein
MKSVLASVLLAGLGLVAAQLDGIPSCAQDCIGKYVTGGGIAGCGQLDIKCICSNEEFIQGISCCLEDACDTAGKDAAVSYAAKICSGEGVTVPSEVTCSSKDQQSSAAPQSGSAATPTESNPTGTPTGNGDAGAGETESPGAAAGLGAASGAMGAIVAMLMAL